jgi:hypothetical protein
MPRSDKSKKSKPAGLRRTAASKDFSEDNHNKNPHPHSTSDEIESRPSVGSISPVIDAGNTSIGPSAKEGDSNQVPKRRDLITTFTGWLVVVGFLTVILMGIQSFQNGKAIEATINANDIAREALSASQRAWISIDHAKIIDGDLAKNTPARYQLVLANVGHGPAFAARLYTRVMVVPNNFEELRRVFEGRGTGDCVSAANQPSQDIYFPTQKYYRTATITISEKMVPVVHGCIVYETMGTSHQTQFCNFWLIDDAKPASQWESRMCPAGNFAN